ncbi:MAG: hypothetical protein LUD50_00920 [Clostridia bacterium]|nr:hypothetical protein [Clostridia bacterium]
MAKEDTPKGCGTDQKQHMRNKRERVWDFHKLLNLHSGKFVAGEGVQTVDKRKGSYYNSVRYQII